MHEELLKNIPDFFKEPHKVIITSRNHEEVIKTLQKEFKAIHATGKKFYVKLRIVLENMPVMYVYFGNTTDLARSLEFWIFRNPTIKISAFRTDIFEHVEFMYSDNEDFYLDSWIFTFKD